MFTLNSFTVRGTNSSSEQECVPLSQQQSYARGISRPATQVSESGNVMPGQGHTFQSVPLSQQQSYASGISRTATQVSGFGNVIPGQGHQERFDSVVFPSSRVVQVVPLNSVSRTTTILPAFPNSLGGGYSGRVIKTPNTLSWSGLGSILAIVAVAAAILFGTIFILI